MSETRNEGGDIELPLEKEVEYFETRDKDWDDERNALPVAIPFEEEVERISPTAMIAMQTALHDKSLGISLLGKSRRGRPKKSPEPNPATVVTTAIGRLWKILRACHEEKWRRQRESPCYAAIADTPLESLGITTIELLRRVKSLPKAVGLAVTQIECDAYRRLWVSRGGSHKQGVSWFLLTKSNMRNIVRKWQPCPWGSGNGTCHSKRVLRHYFRFRPTIGERDAGRCSESASKTS